MSRKHPHRLPPSEYVGSKRYSLTICTFQRSPHFAKAVLAKNVIDQLEINAKLYAFEVIAYCVMPDHVHMLTEGSKDDSALQKFVRVWKQVTAFAARRSHNIKLWQRSYYEHTLRDDESTRGTAIYILNNPVRAGLTDHPSKYPWLGSFTTTVEALLDIAQDEG